MLPYKPGSRDDAEVRALASHQRGPGSILRPGITCGLSLLLVLVPAPRVFLRVLRFSSLHKNQHFLILIWSGNSGWRATLWKCHCKFSFIFKIFFLTSLLFLIGTWLYNIITASVVQWRSYLPLPFKQKAIHEFNPSEAKPFSFFPHILFSF